MKKLRSQSLIAAGIALVCAAAILVIATPSAQAVTCTDVHVVWARGSGEPIDGSDSHGRQLRDSLSPRFVAQEISFSWAELGGLDGDYTEGQGGYPAIAVEDWADWAPPNFDPDAYYDSVEIGELELTNYLNSRAVACPNEAYVLGGYSQGAEVIGASLPYLHTDAQHQIAFVALYGDPRYHGGSSANPMPWWGWGSAHGFQLSGFLGARTPYVPTYLVDGHRLGSWCALGDAFCASAFPAGEAVHTDAYVESGGYIEQSAQVIASMAIIKVHELVPPDPGGDPGDPGNGGGDPGGLGPPADPPGGGDPCDICEPSP